MNKQKSICNLHKNTPADESCRVRLLAHPHAKAKHILYRWWTGFS